MTEKLQGELDEGGGGLRSKLDQSIPTDATPADQILTSRLAGRRAIDEEDGRGSASREAVDAGVRGKADRESIKFVSHGCGTRRIHAMCTIAPASKKLTI